MTTFSDVTIRSQPYQRMFDSGSEFEEELFFPLYGQIQRMSTSPQHHRNLDTASNTRAQTVRINFLPIFRILSFNWSSDIYWDSNLDHLHRSKGPFRRATPLVVEPIFDGAWVRWVASIVCLCILVSFVSCIWIHEHTRTRARARTHTHIYIYIYMVGKAYYYLAR